MQVATTTCTYGFLKAMSSSCRHTSAISGFPEMAVHEKDICAAWQTTEYYKGCSVLAATQVYISAAPECTAVQFQHQLYRLSFDTAKRLATDFSHAAVSVSVSVMRLMPSSAPDYRLLLLSIRLISAVWWVKWLNFFIVLGLNELKLIKFSVPGQLLVLLSIIIRKESCFVTHVSGG